MVLTNKVYAEYDGIVYKKYFLYNYKIYLFINLCVYNLSVNNYG